MKLRILGSAIAGVFMSGLSFGQMVMDSPEAFFYNMGYKKGYEIGKKQGYVEGYRRALEDVKKVLKLYKADIEALEAGKYLYKEKLVTYPRVFRLKDREGYRIVVRGCQIEDVRSLDQIFEQEGLRIPVLDFTSVLEAQKAQANILSFPELSKKVEETTRVPPKPIFVRVSPSATGLLEKYNIPYVIEGLAEGKVIKAVFFSQKEADEFCNTNKGACTPGGSDELEEY